MIDQESQKIVAWTFSICLTAFSVVSLWLKMNKSNTADEETRFTKTIDRLQILLADVTTKLAEESIQVRVLNEIIGTLKKEVANLTQTLHVVEIKLQQHHTQLKKYEEIFMPVMKDLLHQGIKNDS